MCSTQPEPIASWPGLCHWGYVPSRTGCVFPSPCLWGSYIYQLVLRFIQWVHLVSCQLLSWFLPAYKLINPASLRNRVIHLPVATTPGLNTHRNLLPFDGWYNEILRLKGLKSIRCYNNNPDKPSSGILSLLDILLISNTLLLIKSELNRKRTSKPLTEHLWSFSLCLFNVEWTYLRIISTIYSHWQ